LSRGKKKADLSKIIASKRQVEHTPEKKGKIAGEKGGGKACQAAEEKDQPPEGLFFRRR
jgi:hypothetical protein